MVQGSEYQGNYMQWTPSRMVSVLQMPQYLKMKSRVDLQLHKDASRDELKINLQLKEVESLVEKDKMDKLSEKQRILMLEHSSNESKKNKLMEWIQQNEALEYDGFKSSNEIQKQKFETSEIIAQNSLHNDDIKNEIISDNENNENIENIGQHKANELLTIKKEENSDEEQSYHESDEDASLASSDEDEEQDILKELQKLREEKQRESELEKELNEAVELQKILQSNSLLNKPSNTTLKRKWTEDTVFKNQAHFESNKKPRFVNDTIRNESHKKFMYSIMQ